MTPVKGEGSSRRKGKEIAVDDPATKTVGEDTPLSESEPSKEEERSRDPNNECAPLIDPRNDTHAHFSMAPGDYLPPLPSHVWLSIFPSRHRGVLGPFSFFNPRSQYMPRYLFEFGSSTSLGWKEWINEEFFDTAFMVALQQAGVLKAIVSSCCLSNYKGIISSPFGPPMVHRHPQLLPFLRRDHSDPRRCGKPMVVAHSWQCWPKCYGTLSREGGRGGQVE